jgi:hypothetical protein
VENNQYRLVCRLFRLMKESGVLEHVVLIGSWCLLVYKQYFTGIPFEPGIRTRDIDLLVPIPLRLKQPVDIEEMVSPLGFILSRKGAGGYMQFVHSELMLEFIVPQRGRGSEKPIDLPALGINAQPLRFMDFLCEDALRLPFGDIEVSVPHPARFALVKLIISHRRQKPIKRENDLRQAERVLIALRQNAEVAILKKTVDSMPKKWQQAVQKSLLELPEGDQWIAILKE